MPSRRMVRFSYRSSLGNTGLDRDSAPHAAIVATGVLPQDAGWSAAQAPDPGIAARAASIQLISPAIRPRGIPGTATHPLQNSCTPTPDESLWNQGLARIDHRTRP